MTPEKLIERLKPWREAHARRAYVPQHGTEASKSRFGGAPDMSASDSWPACATCERPMLFILQLDLGAVPGELGEGLIQLFYCSTGTVECETWAPFAGANEVRWSQGDFSRRAVPPGTRILTERPIVGWDEIVDLPHPEEHARLGLIYHYDFGAGTVRIECPELGIDEGGLDIEAYSAELIAEARDLDKLLGWPRFVQGRNYPSCPRCGEELRFLFQIDSEVGTDLKFGDVGIGHIMRCDTHPDVVTFAWDCH